MREAIHPGEYLAEEMEERALNAAELARRINVPTNRVTGILNGKRAITAETAKLFADVFGTSAMFWMNLQSLYELRRVPSPTKSYRLEHVAPGKRTATAKMSPPKSVAFRSTETKVVSKRQSGGTVSKQRSDKVVSKRRVKSS
jgi:antitoxin HigA-1